MPLTRNPDEIKAFISALSVVSFGFIVYYIIINRPAFKLWESQSSGNTRQIMIQRLTGIFFFGFVSLIIIRFFLHSNFLLYGIAVPGIKTFIWLLILSVIIIPMNYYNSKNPENLSRYPEIRNSEWSYSLIILSVLSWIAYLLAYEFMFRGFLLFSSVSVIGIWPSIILNTAIYSLVHIRKGKKESFGAIPFGISISYLVIETGTFWIAFFSHVVLALTNECFSFIAQPGMFLNKSGRL